MSRFILSIVLGLAVLGFTQAGDAYAARSPANQPGLSKASQFKSSAYRLKRDGTPVIKRGTAKGDITIEVSRNAQKMNVYVAGQLAHTWAVSTGRRGYKTPSGAYRPTWMTPSSGC